MRFKPVGVLEYPNGLFSCLKSPLKRSDGYSSAHVHLASARCKGGRPAGGGWMWVDVQEGCGMGLACYGYLCVPSFVHTPVWSATTALRASVASEEVRMRHAKPYWMVFMLFCVPNMR